MSDDDEPIIERKPAFLKRVRVRNYKSLVDCDVTLEPFTILVGRNAAGKSNFIDALAFLRDSMTMNFAEAAGRRGGWDAIHSRHASDGCIGYELTLVLTNPEDWSEVRSFHFKLELRKGPDESPVSVCESLREQGQKVGYAVDCSGDEDVGVWTWDEQLTSDSHPWPHPGRIWLGELGKVPMINVAETIRGIGLYHPDPRIMRLPQTGTQSRLLDSDGHNVARILERMALGDGHYRDRLIQYLSAVVPEVREVTPVRLGKYETLSFMMGAAEDTSPTGFDADAVSDGTLRTLATLVAAFQFIPDGPALVAIEEPEASLHPAAAAALVAALDEAAMNRQVLITTHSPELLDGEDVRPENVRVVKMVRGRTEIGPVSPLVERLIHKSLHTLGSLEREDRLQSEISEQPGGTP